MPLPSCRKLESKNIFLMHPGNGSNWSQSARLANVSVGSKIKRRPILHYNWGSTIQLQRTPWIFSLTVEPCCIPNSAANICISGVISQFPLWSRFVCLGWGPHLSDPPILSIWLCISSNSSAATACRFPISMSKLLLGISGLIAWPKDIEVLKTEEESPFTWARKLFLELGILEKKISLILRQNPRLWGFIFPSYRYRKFSYVVCIKNRN